MEDVTMKNPKTLTIKDLLDRASSVPEHSLRAVTIDSDGALVIPFTDELGVVDVHFCKEEEINKYLQCNGEGCILCQTKKRKQKRLLLPVYQPITKSIEILTISDSLQPDSLLHQLADVLTTVKEGPPKSMLITRNAYKYEVGVAELPADCDDGRSVIKKFEQLMHKGKVELSHVIPNMDNETLAGISSIAERLKFLGR